MAFTDKAWDGSASRWPDSASYCKSCLIDDNPAGKEKIQALCHLPVAEPDGTINANAVHNAVARLMQTKTSPANKKAAARKLKSLYGQMGVKQEDIPESLQRMTQ